MYALTTLDAKNNAHETAVYRAYSDLVVKRWWESKREKLCSDRQNLFQYLSSIFVDKNISPYSFGFFFFLNIAAWLRHVHLLSERSLLLVQHVDGNQSKRVQSVSTNF
jgi:hypothetical protein